MDVFAVQDDGSEQLLAAGLDAKEVWELEEWWCYTKPFGSGIKVMVRPDCRTIPAFRTAGTEPGLAVEAPHPEIFIG
jgi:hypothetical protein